MTKDGLNLTAQVKKPDFAPQTLHMNIQGARSDAARISPNRLQ